MARVRNTSGDEAPRSPVRYLVEVRGVLHVDAPDGRAADRLVREWIAAIGRHEAPPSPEVNVGWLRIFPETDDPSDDTAL
jgi:hypothetical protein